MKPQCLKLLTSLTSVLALMVVVGTSATVVTGLVMPDAAWAKPNSGMTGDKEKDKAACERMGGTFDDPGGPGGSYSCDFPDGTSIICNTLIGGCNKRESKTEIIQPRTTQPRVISPGVISPPRKPAIVQPRTSQKRGQVQQRKIGITKPTRPGEPMSEGPDKPGKPMPANPKLPKR